MPDKNDMSLDALNVLALIERQNLRLHQRGTTELSLQYIKDSTAFLLLLCAVRRSRIPAQLALLVAELLDDPKRGLASLSANIVQTHQTKAELIDPGLRATESNDQKDWPELRDTFVERGRRVSSKHKGVNHVGAQTFDKATLAEADYPADPTNKNPSTASVKRIAELSGASRDTITRWRKQARYRGRVTVLRDSKGLDATD